MLQPLDKVVFKGMKVSYDQNLSKWQREHPGNILSKKDFVCLLSKVWDTYFTPSLIEKSFKATGIFDLSVPMRVNPSVIDQTKFEPTKLRRYAQMKKEQEENSGTSKVTTTVNTELEKITFSVTFSPKKLLGNQSKTFEEILLDSIKRPDLPSVSGIEKRKKIAREAEVITSKEHLEVLKREENLKAKGKGKKKSSDGKGIKSNKKIFPKREANRDTGDSESDISLELGSDEDDQSIQDTIQESDSDDKETPSKQKIVPKLNEYYAVRYDARNDEQGYIGRVLDFPDEGKVKLKFLHCLSLATYSFNWPKKDNIDTVDDKYILQDQ